VNTTDYNPFILISITQSDHIKRLSHSQQLKENSFEDPQIQSVNVCAFATQKRRESRKFEREFEDL